MSQENEPLGSVGEEAVKLLGALQDWARKSGSEYADAAAAAGSGAASFFEAVDEHIATGAKECRYCPLCRAISRLREISPEVMEHLSSAATSLAQALVSAMATDVASHKPRTDDPVEHIDLDDDWED